MRDVQRSKYLQDCVISCWAARTIYEQRGRGQAQILRLWRLVYVCSEYAPNEFTSLIDINPIRVIVGSTRWCASWYTSHSICPQSFAWGLRFVCHFDQHTIFTHKTQTHTHTLTHLSNIQWNAVAFGMWALPYDIQCLSENYIQSGFRRQEHDAIGRCILMANQHQLIYTVT